MVIYHAFPERLHGGFAGVDIFFVISGFLISSIIYRNLLNTDNPGHVRIVDFYIRRVKRIFPALIVVLLTCLGLGWFILLPDEYALLGKHVMGGATYINNFMLYFENGDYFNPDSNLKPLLHLWSLGVEEQFYLIFPLFLYLVYKSNLNFVLCLTVFTVLSFCLNRNGINHGSQAFVFYMPWTRFWELSAGAILAYVVNYYEAPLQRCKARVVNSRALGVLTSCLLRKSGGEQSAMLLNNLLSITGIALIIVGYFTLKEGVKFPGTRALIPVCGALMIIAAGREAFINRHVLSNPVMMFLGLISYPLYLWHWPLLSFAYIMEGEMPDVTIRVAAVVIAIVLASVTFLFIEPPLRYGKHLGTKAVVLFLVLLLTGFLGYRVYDTGGFKKRFATETSPEIAALHHEIDKKRIACEERYPEWKKQDNKCFMTAGSGKATVAVFGDSHAGHLNFGLQKEMSAKDRHFNLFSASCQIPFYGFKSATQDPNVGAMRAAGSDLRDQAFLDELKDPAVETLVFAHNSGCSFYGLIDKLDDANNSLPIEEKYRIGFKRTMDMVAQAGKRALFVFDNPSLPFEPNSCVVRPISISTRACSFDRQQYDQEPSHVAYEQVISSEIQHYSNASIVKLAPLFCDEHRCRAAEGGQVLYMDRGHLNQQGSQKVAPTIVSALEELIGTR